jgi:hypothetical protein
MKFLVVLEELSTKGRSSTMSADGQGFTDEASGTRPRLAALSVFGLVGALIGFLVLNAFLAVAHQRCGADGLRKTHTLLADQMTKLRSGKTDCLVQPDPRFVEELLADRACSAKIRELCLGADVADPRLGRLRELPNLKSVVLLSARDPDKFLERLRGSATIEDVSLVYCRPSPHSTEHLRSLPKLRRFGLCVNHFDSADWDAIRKALPGCQCNLVVSNR